MKKKSKEDFTVSEICILKLLWKKGRPLTVAEIMDNLPELNLVLTSIYVILNGMINKGVISLDGMERYKKRSSKTYKAIIGPEDFATMQINKLLPEAPRRDRMLSIVSFMAEHDGLDAETISALEKYLQKKRKELEDNGNK